MVSTREAKLDLDAWRQALSHNPRLTELQNRANAADTALREAQAPYMAPIAPEFVIR